MEILDAQTRELVFDHLDGAMGLDDLRRRLMPIAWRLDSELVAATNPVTSKVSLYIAEYERGHRSESELRDLLSRASSTVLLVATDLPPRATATTTRETRSARYPAVEAGIAV